MKLKYYIIICWNKLKGQKKTRSKRHSLTEDTKKLIPIKKKGSKYKKLDEEEEEEGEGGRSRSLTQIEPPSNSEKKKPKRELKIKRKKTSLCMLVAIVLLKNIHRLGDFLAQA